MFRSLINLFTKQIRIRYDINAFQIHAHNDVVVRFDSVRLGSAQYCTASQWIEYGLDWIESGVTSVNFNRGKYF